jgi:hypothetical protein
MTRKLIDLYPVIIRQARYNGLYEGGKWIAFAECEEFTDAMNDYFYGDDCDAADLFTDEYKKTVGIGVSPDHAYADLCYKNGIPIDLLEDWYPL